MTRPPPNTPAMDDPATIYQDWLDMTGSMILSGDIESLAEHIGIPFLMRTTTGETVFETVEDMIADMTPYSESLRAQGVTHYIRLIKKARYINEGLIEGWHKTYILCNANTLVAPFGNRMLLKYIGGRWRVIEAEHEVSNSTFPIQMLRPVENAFEHRWAEPMSDIRSTHARAEPIYQAYLDALSETVHNRDLDAWCALFTMPHYVHYDAADHEVNSCRDVRPFFETLLAMMDEKGADTLKRSAKFAEFIAGERIIGYHDTVLTRAGEVVFGPVKSRMIIHQQGKGWVCHEVANSLTNKEFPGREFEPSDKLPTVRAIQKRMKT